MPPASHFKLSTSHYIRHRKWKDAAAGGISKLLWGEINILTAWEPPLLSFVTRSLVFKDSLWLFWTLVSSLVFHKRCYLDRSAWGVQKQDCWWFPCKMQWHHSCLYAFKDTYCHNDEFFLSQILTFVYFSCIFSKYCHISYGFFFSSTVFWGLIWTASATFLVLTAVSR